MKERFKLYLLQPLVQHDRYIHEAALFSHVKDLIDLIDRIARMTLVALGGTGCGELRRLNPAVDHVFAGDLIDLSLHHEVEVDGCCRGVVHVALQSQCPEQLLIVVRIREAHEINGAVPEHALLV